MATTPDNPQPDWIEPQSPPEFPGEQEPIGEPGNWPDEIDPDQPDEIDQNDTYEAPPPD